MTSEPKGDASRRCADEDGVVLVLCAMVMVALLVMAALVIDLGYARGGSRLNQTTADLSALAGGKNLDIRDYSGACQNAVNYLNSNAKGMPAIGAAGFCGQSGNNVATTTCSGGPLAQAKPTISSGRFTVSVHFPVPDSEITDPGFGAGLNDGAPCDRMRVIVTSKEPSFFGGVVDSDGLTVTRSATVRVSAGTSKRAPALWLLDPTGCVGLDVTGGSHVSVGTSTVPGIITVDSDGTDCNGGQTTLDAGGAGTKIDVVPTPAGVEDGSIDLFALAAGATTCSVPACDPADVPSQVNTQPVAAGERATRAPVDWTFNCKTGYPDYHGIPIADCSEAPARPAYIDLLKAAVGTSGQPGATGVPGAYQRWTTAGHSCNSATVTVSGNWWVDCPGGLSIGTGSSVTFENGNVVLDGGLKMTGSGVLRVNTANSVPSLPSSCLPPAVSTPCIYRASAAAGFVYVRAGDLSLTGGTFAIKHSAVYVASGVVKVAGGAPSWSAPSEGPFAGLSLWAEAVSNGFQINGGAGVVLSGTFFTPEAKPLSLAGGGNWGQQSAQFISYHLAVSGGAILSVSPDPDNAIPLPPKTGVLIR